MRDDRVEGGGARCRGDVTSLSVVLCYCFHFFQSGEGGLIDKRSRSHSSILSLSLSLNGFAWHLSTDSAPEYRLGEKTDPRRCTIITQHCALHDMCPCLTS